MNREAIQSLMQERKDLREQIYALEMADDMLFTNRNGNLERYTRMSNRLMQIDRLLGRSK